MLVKQPLVSMLLVSSYLALILPGCGKSQPESKKESAKPKMFQTQLNALEKAKKVEGQIKKAAQTRSLEVERQDQ